MVFRFFVCVCAPPRLSAMRQSGSFSVTEYRPICTKKNTIMKTYMLGSVLSALPPAGRGGENFVVDEIR